MRLALLFGLGCNGGGNARPDPGGGNARPDPDTAEPSDAAALPDATDAVDAGPDGLERR